MNTITRIILLLALAAIATPAIAGSLNNAGSPADGSGMPTTTEIYNRLDSGAAIAAPGAFKEPTAGPTVGSGRSLADIALKLPAPDNTNGATAAEVQAGKIFWGLRTDGTWGVKTGKSHIASIVCQAGWASENCDVVDKCVDVTCPTNHSKILTCNYMTGVCSNPLEVCDAVDNDGNGFIDDDAIGTNLPCGSNVGVCTPGITSCLNGTIVCVGGVKPNPEMCDGKDNDCNGVVDDGPLTGAPTASGCWNLPGVCCNFTDGSTSLSWCPPAGATCNGLGVLSLPNQAGTLVCGGASGWQCLRVQIYLP